MSITDAQERRRRVLEGETAHREAGARPYRRRTRRALKATIDLYEAWGKPEKAKEWREKLEAANSAAEPAKK